MSWYDPIELLRGWTSPATQIAHDTHHEDERAAIVALKDAIGNNPQQGYASLTALLAAILANGWVTNARVASGIDAAKITTGTLPSAQVPNLDAAKVTTGTITRPVTTTGTVQGAYLRGGSGSGNPSFAVVQVGGVLDGSGNGVAAHNVVNMHLRVMMASAFYRGNALEAKPLTINAIDGTNVHVMSGVPNRGWEATVLYAEVNTDWPTVPA